MAIVLNTDNVFDYLAALGYCAATDRSTSQIKVISGKNFNLAISFIDGRNLLVKQGVCGCIGEQSTEFSADWRIQQLVKNFKSFGTGFENFLPELLHFDPDNSILIVKFLVDYCDLSDYYAETQNFSIKIAKSIGKTLGKLHDLTFEDLEYKEFLIDPLTSEADLNHIKIIQRLSHLTPNIFRIVTQECLQFYKLYQRSPNLSQAIIDLGNAVQSSCLIHNDLKINNILIASDWEQPGSDVIKIIDWERSRWGDPAFDLGRILGSYLKLWLDGLVIDSSLSIQESLQLATTPLEMLQPSLFHLIQAYLQEFSRIIIARPDYLDRVIQFAGLSLIIRLEIMTNDERVFGNQGIVMLQVAKQLLCNPHSARSTIFGNNFRQLVNH